VLLPSCNRMRADSPFKPCDRTRTVTATSSFTNVTSGAKIAPTMMSRGDVMPTP
jgi:hypothetical protein